MRSAPAITFWCGGCHLALPKVASEAQSVELLSRNAAAGLPSPRFRMALRELSSLAGKDRWNPEKENKGHPPQRSFQTLRLFMLHYTSHRKMYVAGISRPVLPPSAIRPSHSESTMSIQLRQLREKIKYFFYVSLSKQKRNSNCPIQLI